MQQTWFSKCTVLLSLCPSLSEEVLGFRCRFGSYWKRTDCVSVSPLPPFFSQFECAESCDAELHFRYIEGKVLRRTPFIKFVGVLVFFSPWYWYSAGFTVLQGLSPFPNTLPNNNAQKKWEEFLWLFDTFYGYSCLWAAGSHFLQGVERAMLCFIHFKLILMWLGNSMP